MSKTKRCIDCPIGQEHWSDEICGSCGRCQLHCQEYPASFSKDAKDSLERPHPLAGQTFLFGWNQMPEDPDRALVPIQPGVDGQPGGLQPRGELAVFASSVARSSEDPSSSDYGRGESVSVRRERQRSAESSGSKRRHSGGDAK